MKNLVNIPKFEQYKQLVFSTSDIVNEIIKNEGPIHHDLLIKRIFEAFYYKWHYSKKITSRIKKEIEEIFLNNETFINKYMKDGNFYYLQNSNFCRQNDKEIRKIKYISDIEIKDDIKEIIRMCEYVNKDGIFSMLNELLDFSSLTKENRERYEKCLKSLLDHNQIIKCNNSEYFRLSKKS